MNFAEIVDYLKLNDFSVESLPNKLMPICIVKNEELLAIAHFLKNDTKLLFDQLSCLTGIDNGIEKGTMDVIYNLNSIINNHTFCIKVIVPRGTSPTAEVCSVASIWQTANWHEREAYDLLGISFENHPDLRRILLPADWEGHPLRKDYSESIEYHNMKIKSN